VIGALDSPMSRSESRVEWLGFMALVFGRAGVDGSDGRINARWG